MTACQTESILWLARPVMVVNSIVIKSSLKSKSACINSRLAQFENHAPKFHTPSTGMWCGYMVVVALVVDEMLTSCPWNIH